MTVKPSNSDFPSDAQMAYCREIALAWFDGRSVGIAVARQEALKRALPAPCLSSPLTWLRQAFDALRCVKRDIPMIWTMTNSQPYAERLAEFNERMKIRSARR